MILQRDGTWSSGDIRLIFGQVLLRQPSMMSTTRPHGTIWTHVQQEKIVRVAEEGRGRKIGQRGNGPNPRHQRSDALGPRKDVIIRMPEDLARQLKIVAAHEEMTITDFCLQAIVPQIDQALAKHGLQLDR